MIEVKIIDGLTNYNSIYELQLETRDRVISRDKENTVFILEHKPVYTLGKHGGMENLIKESDIPIVQIERGGNITYHGPGQLVIYPIINLKELKIGVKDFISKLESVAINICRELEVESSRNPLNRGVWVGSSKIASIGVSIKKGVSIHGMALNINTNLDHFSNINLCGLEGVMATSVEFLTGKVSSMDRVKEIAKEEILKLFTGGRYE